MTHETALQLIIGQSSLNTIDPCIGWLIGLIIVTCIARLIIFKQSGY